MIPGRWSDSHGAHTVSIHVSFWNILRKISLLFVESESCSRRGTYSILRDKIKVASSAYRQRLFYIFLFKSLDVLVIEVNNPIEVDIKRWKKKTTTGRVFSVRVWVCFITLHQKPRRVCVSVCVWRRRRLLREYYNFHSASSQGYILTGSKNRRQSKTDNNIYSYCISMKLLRRTGTLQPSYIAHPRGLQRARERERRGQAGWQCSDSTSCLLSLSPRISSGLEPIPIHICFFKCRGGVVYRRAASLMIEERAAEEGVLTVIKQWSGCRYSSTAGAAILWRVRFIALYKWSPRSFIESYWPLKQWCD